MELKWSAISLSLVKIVFSSIRPVGQDGDFCLTNNFFDAIPNFFRVFTKIIKVFILGYFFIYTGKGSNFIFFILLNFSWILTLLIFVNYFFLLGYNRWSNPRL